MYGIYRSNLGNGRHSTNHKYYRSCGEIQYILPNEYSAYAIICRIESEKIWV